MSRAWIKDEWIADGWRTPDTYSNEFQPLPDAPGIYFLVWFNQRYEAMGIAYFGQAKNLARRLKNHPIRRLILAQKFTWAQRWFKCFLPAELCKRELMYIQKYNPPFNINGRVRGGA